MRWPSALAHRNYRLFFTGQAVSLLGMWLQMTAQAWLIYQLTDSAAVVALLAVAQQGPGLVLGPFAGALADRHDKRNLLLAALSGAVIPAFALGVLTLLGAVRPWHIVALAFGAGLSRAFEIPTRHAILPEVVGLQALPSAVFLNSALFNGARLVGPPVAGIITAGAGAAWCFLGNGVSYLAIIGALLMMRLPAKTPSSRAATSLFTEIREAFSYVAQHPKLRALFIALGISSFAGMSYAVLLPSFAKRVLMGGAGTFGLLQGAIGAGAISSALVLATRRSADGLERWTVGSAAVFGGALIALGRTQTLGSASLALFVVGMAFMVQTASTTTLIQLTVPDRLRGRVMAFHTALFLGAYPLGGLIAGTLADRFGEAPVLLAGGTVVLCGTAAVGRSILAHRRHGEAPPSTVADSPPPA